MSRTLLVTRPNHDLTTNYLFFWSQHIIDLARSKHYTIHDLSAHLANRKEFESRLRSRQQSLVFLNGHGNDTELTGHNNEPLVIWQKNEKLLKGTIVYARSCDVGGTLGKSLVKSGVEAFIGYARKFAFWYETTDITHPLRDPTAKIFLGPSNTVMMALIKHNTAEVAYKRSQKAMRRNLRSLLSSASVKNQQAIAFSLWSNIKGQVLLGNSQACLQ